MDDKKSGKPSKTQHCIVLDLDLDVEDCGDGNEDSGNCENETTFENWQGPLLALSVCVCV